MKGDKDSEISNLEITVSVKEEFGFDEFDVLNEYEAESTQKFRVYDHLANQDKTVGRISTAWLECPDDLERDMKITFTRSDSSARDQMTALYFTIYLDGSPYFGFSVSEGWCEEIFMAGSREWVDGEDLSSPLRFGTLMSTEDYTKAMSMESALQVGEILITVELGKLVGEGSSRSNPRTLKPTAWTPPKLELVDRPVHEEKKALIDRALKHGTARPIAPLPKRAADSQTKPGIAKASKVVKKAPPAVQVFEPLHSDHIDFAFVFKYRSRDFLLAQRVVTLSKEQHSASYATALEESLAEPRLLKRELNRLRRRLAEPPIIVPEEDAIVVDSD